MPKSIVDHLQATEQVENVQASPQALKQHTDVADQLSLPKLLTENSKNESPIRLEQHTDRLDQEQPHSENQLQEAETNSFQLAEQETGSAGQQIFADSKVDPAQPLGDQQHIAQIVGQQEPTSAQDARKRGYQPSIPFNMLIPILQAHLDRDKDMQLQTVWAKLRRNDIHKDDFLRVIRNIVGDQMLKQAAHKVFAQMQAQAQRNNQANANQHPLLSQGSTTQQSSSSGSAQSHDQQVHMPTPSNLGQKSQASSQPTPPNLGQKSQASSQPAPSNPGQKSQASSQAFATISDTRAQNNRHYFFAHNNPVPKPDAKGTHIIPNRPPSMRPAISLQMQTMNKQQQLAKAQQASQQIYGTTNPPAQSYPQPISDSTPLRSLSSESEMQPSLHPHGMVSAKIGTAPTYLTMQHNAGGQQMQQNKDLSCNAGGQQMQQNKDLKTSAVNPSANTKQDSEPAGKARLVGTGGSSAKLHGKQASPNRSTPPVTRSKKSGAQKKPLETAGSTPPPSSKKQKTSGAFQLQEQSIDQLNDVTAVSGVNLREEEEQLLATPKEESRVSIAARLIAQEEEENLFLQKGPLLKKLSGIILASNLKNISCDVERCLSMCVEERLRRFISTIIRFSKQRIDTEKTGHRLVITSDVGRHILQMNQKAKEEWDKKQAEETGKSKKQTEVDGSGGADLDKEKEESRPKNVKPNKEEDDKMRTTAANVAARQAVGGSDMLSKWQLMAEQARQKREGFDVGSASQRALVPRPSHMLGKGPMENQEASKRTHSAAFGTGGMNRQGRGPFAAPHSKGPQRTVSVKDVISALEREPQMTKSRLIYRLYERLHGDSNRD